MGGADYSGHGEDDGDHHDGDGHYGDRHNSDHQNGDQPDGDGDSFGKGAGRGILHNHCSRPSHNIIHCRWREIYFIQ